MSDKHIEEIRGWLAYLATERAAYGIDADQEVTAERYEADSAFLLGQLAAETAKRQALEEEINNPCPELEAERRAHTQTRQKLEAAERELADSVENWEKVFALLLPVTNTARSTTVSMVEKVVQMLSSTRQRLEQVEGALRFQDPRNAAARYDRIADDFERETGLWPPGRSRPAAMGADPQRETSHARWRDYCNEWHEKFFDAALHGTTKPEGWTAKSAPPRYDEVYAAGTAALNADAAASPGAGETPAREQCAFCIHPVHSGTCTGRSGGTAYACGCHHVNAPHSPTTEGSAKAAKPRPID